MLAGLRVRRIPVAGHSTNDMKGLGAVIRRDPHQGRLRAENVGRRCLEVPRSKVRVLPIAGAGAPRGIRQFGEIIAGHCDQCGPQLGGLLLLGLSSDVNAKITECRAAEPSTRRPLGMA